MAQEKTTPHISIISPVYESAGLVELLVDSIIESMKEVTDSYEIILVDDGSVDNSWEKIDTCCKNDPRLRGIQLSRNFGQHYAITAGLENSSGDWVIVMDCDLQDRPDEIVNLYNKALEGYDIVLAQRHNRQDSLSKKSMSFLFSKLFEYLTDTNHDNSVANFGIYRRKVIDSILAMKDQIRVFPILVQWVGFRKISIPVTHSKRTEGKSSYTLPALFALAFDIVISFSQKPLILTLKLGISIALLSFFVGLLYLYHYWSGNIRVPGYTSLIISIWFLSGIVISIMGVLGLYIGKIFERVKGRPLFIVNLTKNIN
jgi:dolichol-phosphate mannosyltransferase